MCLKCYVTLRILIVFLHGQGNIIFALLFDVHGFHNICISQSKSQRDLAFHSVIAAAASCAVEHGSRSIRFIQCHCFPLGSASIRLLQYQSVYDPGNISGIVCTLESESDGMCISKHGLLKLACTRAHT